MSCALDQLDPFQDSVCDKKGFGGGPYPPKLNADVLSAPELPLVATRTFKSATSVQAEPFQLSVTASCVVVCPPKANADVLVPAPLKTFLAVFKSPTSVQLVPFHDSFNAETGGVLPPTAIAAVELPAPANSLLAVFKSLTSVQT